MKRIVTFLMLTGIIYLSSCGNGNNDSLPVVPVADTMSKGGFIQLSYVNDSGLISSFSINDVTIRNVAYYSLFASDIYNATDSLWHCKIQLTDLKMQQLAFTVNLINTSSTGTFTVTTNNSGFIDYTHGENITYSIYAGSTVEITQSSYPIQGNFNLILYKNHVTYPATGSFKIYY